MVPDSPLQKAESPHVHPECFGPLAVDAERLLLLWPAERNRGVQGNTHPHDRQKGNQARYAGVVVSLVQRLSPMEASSEARAADLRFVLHWRGCCCRIIG